jgi:hypothetical protein
LIGSKTSTAEAARDDEFEDARSAWEGDDAWGRGRPLGSLPLVALISAIGLFVICGADYLARSGASSSEAFWWLGLAILVAPPFVRLVSTGAGRSERMALVVLLGLGLYLVKVASNPYTFAYPDEFAHDFNVAQILSTQHLFTPNSLIVVTPLYPGLANVTTALQSLTGLSTFQAGLVIIGCARMFGMLGLFLLIEQVSRSSRVAGLGTAVYAANPNFAFYSAEFGYESLALPLAILVVFAAARRFDTAHRAERAGWTVAACLSILAVVVTHHITSYALAATLVVACLVGLYIRRRRADVAIPWDLAAVAVVASLGWLVSVASPTLVYLGAVFGPAAQQTLFAALSGRPVRGLFQSAPGVITTPLWQQLIGFASVLLMVAGLIRGLLIVRRRRMTNIFAPVLLIAAAVYVPLQGLRLTQAAWETANRSSEFLFIGVGLAVALAVTSLDTTRRLTASLLAAGGVVLVLGGIMVGWTYLLQVPPPYLTLASNGRAIEPENATDARWMLDAIGDGKIVVTDQSNALFLTDYAREVAYTGQERGTQGLFFAPTIDASVLDVLRTVQPQYIVFDRRQRSWDHLVGFFPPGGAGPLGSPSPLMDPSATAKFDSYGGVDRIADSGNIVVYAVRGANSASSR